MRKQDLSGKRYGRYTVLHQVPSTNSQLKWLCRCDCGTKKAVCGGHLKNGKIVSCGCHRKAVVSASHTKHGHNRAGQRTRIYRIWVSMRDKSPNEVCERWRTFASFLADMGEPPDGHTIHRKDMSETYCLENCLWSPTAEAHAAMKQFRKKRPRKKRPRKFDRKAYARQYAKKAYQINKSKSKDIPTEKRCSKCRLVKPSSEFNHQCDSANGLTARCKHCMILARGRTPKIVSVNWSEAETAYLAALIDGEGHFGLSRSIRKNGEYSGHIFYHAFLIITNTSESLCQIQTNYGVGSIKKRIASNTNHKDQYIWTVCPSELRVILPLLLPWLRIRKRQAEVLLEYLTLARCHRDRDGVYSSKVATLYEETKCLNHRGRT